MEEKTKSKQILMVSFISIMLLIVSKIFQYNFLDEKYFYDSKKVLYLMNGIGDYDKSYGFTKNFYNTINFFNFNSLISWSIFLGIIGILILFIIIKKMKNFNLFQKVFLFFSIFWISIYSFNIGKDFIQFIIFFIIYLIISNKRLSQNKKILYSAIIFLIESLFFRIYYLIIAELIVSLYLVYIYMFKGRKINKSKALRLSLTFIFLFIFQIYVISLLSNSNYQDIIQIRNVANAERASSPDANTLINDLLGYNYNFIIFIGNYFINLIRMIFPIELLIKGLKYIPFVLYQFIINYIIFKNMKKFDEKNCVPIVIFISFFLVSVIFEPDFGSLIKHESAIMILLSLII